VWTLYAHTIVENCVKISSLGLELWAFDATALAQNSTLFVTSAVITPYVAACTAKYASPVGLDRLRIVRRYHTCQPSRRLTISYKVISDNKLSAREPISLPSCYWC